MIQVKNPILARFRLLLTIVQCFPDSGQKPTFSSDVHPFLTHVFIMETFRFRSVQVL